MGLRFDPVGGGQLKQAVQQIIQAESQPLKAMEGRKAKEDSRLKLFNEFKSKFSGLDKALNEMSTFRKFRELKVDLGDGGNLMSVTLDKEKAEPGQYTIEIDELAARTSVISNGFSSATDNILGSGFVTLYTSDGSSIDVYIDEEQSSLRGLATQINKQANSPVRAAVVKDVTEPENPYKLVITTKKDGAGNQTEFPDFYFLDGDDFFIDDDREAKNALVAVDGFAIELESNDVSDFLPGVNIHLKQARPDQPFTLTISEDFQKIGGKVKALVDQVNNILQFIYKQNAIDEKSDTSTTFAGDTGLQTIEYLIRNALHEGVPVGDPDGSNYSMMYLHQFGIEFEKSGNVTFKEEKFDKLLESDFDRLAEAITGPLGLVSKLKSLFDTYSRPGSGLLNTKEAGIRARIKDIDNQIETKTRQLERRKQELTDRFSRLEATLGNLQRQQQYMNAVMPSGGNMVSQLLGGG